MADNTETDLLSQANERVTHLLTVELPPSVDAEDAAVHAWLDGFMAGHTAATRSAVRVLGTPTPPAAA